MITTNIKKFCKNFPSILLFTGGKTLENFLNSLLFKTVCDKISHFLEVDCIQSLNVNKESCRLKSCEKNHNIGIACEFFHNMNKSCEFFHSINKACENFHKQLSFNSQQESNNHLELQNKFFIVSADSGLELAEKNNLVSNLILGDMDSIKTKKILNKYACSNIKTFSVYKDYTDTQLAIKEIGDFFCKSFIILIGGDGGRIDHLLSILKIYEDNLCPNLWLTESGALFYLSSDTINFLKVSNLTINDNISVFPLKSKNFFEKSQYKILSKGLEWSIDNLNWQNGDYSVSNRIKNDEKYIELTCVNGRFLIYLPYSCKIE